MNSSFNVAVAAADCNDVIKKINVKSVVVSVVLLFAGTAMILSSVLSEGGATTLSIGMLTAGVLMDFYASFRLFFQNSSYVYAPTGSALMEGSCFVESGDMERINKALDKSEFKEFSSLQYGKNGNSRIDFLMSKDGKFSAVQLFKYVPYNFEPASGVYYFKGEQAFLLSQYIVCVK